MHKYAEAELRRAYKTVVEAREKDTELSIHASDLIDFCPRAFALCADKGLKYHDRKSFGSNMYYVFDVGRKIQDIVVERYQSIKILYGTWKCEECGERSIGLGQRMSIMCPQCRKGRAFYRDTRIVIPAKKYGVPVVGNIDLMLALSIAGKAVILECKSIKSDNFEQLEGPQREHEIQAMVYPWMLTKGAELEGEVVTKLEVVTDGSCIIYASKELPKKGKGDGFPFKFYTVEPNPLVLGPIEKKLGEIKVWKTKKTLPAKICAHKNTLMASQCPAKIPCFE